MDGVADTPEKMDRYIKTIYNKANDMDVLINELSLYSKIDSNIIPYNFRKIDINARICPGILPGAADWAFLSVRRSLKNMGERYGRRAGCAPAPQYFLH